jgi:HemY protein
MRALFWLLALFLAAALVAIAGHYNHGYALLVVPPYRVEIALNFFVLLLLAGFALLYALLRLLAKTVGMPHAVRAFRARKRREKAALALRRALRLMFEGDFVAALKQAGKAFRGGEEAALSALVAARAAHAVGDVEQQAHWLQQAAQNEDDEGEGAAARRMIQAEFDVDAQRYAAALEYLDSVTEGNQRHQAASLLALRAHQCLGHWDQVLRVARWLERQHGAAAESVGAAKRGAHVANIASRARDASQLVAYWNEIPAAERLDSAVAAAAAGALMEAGECSMTRKIVEKHLASRWDAALLDIYGRCIGSETLERISRAEAWLVERPHDALLLLALGRLCRSEQLWGKAQSYLEASTAVEATRAGHLELASLFDELGRTEEADRHFRAAARF